MFNPRSIASQAEAPTPFPATGAADRGGKQRELINGPDVEASGTGRIPRARQRRWRQGLDVEHLRLPALEVRNRHVRTYERVRALVEVLAVTPTTSRGTLKNANPALI
jgi:hypothetical protein